MKNKIIYLVLLTFATVSGYSQGGRTEVKGNKEYDKYAYIDAIKTYERIYEKGYKSPDMILKIGNAYYFNAELEKANKWYSELYTTNPEQEAEFYYRFAQTLRAVKDYPKADAMMTKFNDKSGNDTRAKLFNKKKDYLAEIKKNSGRYKIEDAGINSKYSDYGPAYMGTKVIFTSARDTGNFSKRIHTWTGQYFTNLYSSALAEDGSLSGVDKFGKKINTKYHEDTPAFTKDGKTVYFTRNNYLDGRGFDANKVTLLKIYKANLDDEGKWINITPLNFNSDSYQAAHPALSPDEKTLYFASDMPGTRGQSDLFRVKINEDGSLGTPENLGDAINSEGRETYPFISDDNELYFASDGQPGLGGLDIFVTRIPKDGSLNFKQVLNIGEEGNSSKDDFGFIIDFKSKKGFLSSNRDGGKGSDDIYKFLETRPIFCDQILHGVITDEDTKAVLPNTKLVLMDEKFNKLKETVSDAEGKYEFTEVECGTKYYVNASLEDYETKEVPVIIGSESGKTELNIELKTKTCRVKIGDDLADCFKINIIYFDLDKWNIRPDAAVDLAKLLDVLNQNPTMKINIRSHTDSRASHAYNEKLSDRRAKSTRDWLIKNGIAANRLTSEGLGETELVNKCADGVKCTEEEHQLNRRSEFIITSL
ncbi:OmpA family protein [Flavobacterium sp. J49]|uniref:OmpA family protein n=1 Tax=Flavobacterium sp. J49 TaxID=2718534 RepID=UPI0015933FE5|nr:OmpA family protein [Flavobacterium sp. J49]MBF6642308.1 OmpA family protein [Flavobacterium sp. J49]NIC03554.1 OmpA family protein [Flavobacterium sp. J49]